MRPFLDALNPLHPCFTVSDFEDALIDINCILSKIDTSSSSTQEKMALLEKAFHLAMVCVNASNKPKTDKQLSYLLAETLRQYCSLCYHDNYFAAKQLLLIALNLHLYTIGMLNECIELKDYSSLEDLRKQSEAKPLSFSAMEQSILSMSIDRCISLAYTDSFLQFCPKKRLYNLAETSRWLGHCYQNINDTQIINDENDLRFSQLFHLSEALHVFINDEHSKLALADLYFQAWPFLHQRRNPEDIMEICQLYEKALALDSSPEMHIQTALIRFKILFSNGKKKEAALFLQKARALAEKLEDNNKTRFLLFSLYDHCASVHIDPETVNIDEAETCFTKASQYVDTFRKEGNDWLAFALFDMRYAEYKYVRGEFNTAKKLIERCLSTLQKYPQSKYPFIYQAEAMKSIIDTSKPSA